MAKNGAKWHYGHLMWPCKVHTLSLPVTPDISIPQNEFFFIKAIFDRPVILNIL